MTDVQCAAAIPVADFRLILQWPLILADTGPGGTLLKRRLEETRQHLRASNWKPVPGLAQLGPSGDEEEQTRASYAEFAYFHDYLQEALYPRLDDTSVTIWHSEEYHRIDAELWTGGTNKETGDLTTDKLTFEVDRNTIHLFDIGAAVVTIELRLAGTPILTLDRVLRALDHLRRSYAPFFSFDDKNPKADGVAARCPLVVTLWSGSVPSEFPVQRREDIMKMWTASAKGPQRDIRVFDHWRALIRPLELLADGGPWRDPSDERIPMNSFICIAERPGQTAQDAMLQIPDSDWVRIADAEEPGSSPDPAADWPYNPAFIRERFARAWYDRFFPDPACGIATSRHIFGGMHYSLVGAGGFFGSVIADHFRRHYTQMSLVARLEHAVLLSISSRLTQAVRRRDEPGGNARAFESEVLAIQDQFLTFVHRFRFTGVSSQVQGQEMFDRWRESLGLPALYAEVRDELQAAVESVRARQSERETQAAWWLTVLAAVLGGLGVYLAALAVQGDLAALLGLCGFGEGGKVLLRVLVLTVGAVAVLGGAALFLWPHKRVWGGLSVAAGVALGLALWGSVVIDPPACPPPATAAPAG